MAGSSRGFAVVAIDGMDMGKLRGWLLSKHKIVTTPIVNDEMSGLRVTPSVYTTLEELDRFCDVMESVIEKGLPAA